MSRTFRALSRTSRALSSTLLKKTYTLLVFKYSNILILLNSTSLYRILLIIGYGDTVVDEGRGTFK
jgi:hypothetical protein